MSTQPALPGMESDLRSDIGALISLFLVYGQPFDRGISAWSELRRPRDPSLDQARERCARSLRGLRAAGGTVPAWIPPALLAALPGAQGAA